MKQPFFLVDSPVTPPDHRFDRVGNCEWRHDGVGSFSGAFSGLGSRTGSDVLIGSSAGSTTMAGFSLPVFILAPLELGSTYQIARCTTSILHLLLVFLTQVYSGVLAGGPISLHQCSKWHRVSAVEPSN